MCLFHYKFFKASPFSTDKKKKKKKKKKEEDLLPAELAFPCGDDNSTNSTNTTNGF